MSSNTLWSEQGMPAPNRRSCGASKVCRRPMEDHVKCSNERQGNTGYVPWVTCVHKWPYAQALHSSWRAMMPATKTCLDDYAIDHPTCLDIYVIKTKAKLESQRLRINSKLRNSTVNYTMVLHSRLRSKCRQAMKGPHSSLRAECL